MASVVDDFWSIYKNEWREARQALRRERNEEEIIYLLMRIVRGVYDLCTDEARKVNKTKDVEELMEEYWHSRLPKSFHKEHVTNPVRSFIHRCIESLYKICSSKPTKNIYWIPKGEVIDREKFDIEGNKDEHVCDWTVWPAVMTDDGIVLKKGVVISV